MRVWAIPMRVALAGLLETSALAQVPPSANPGRVDERFKPPPTPESTPEQPLPPPSVVTPTPQELAAQFTLNGVTIEGSTVFATADFTPLHNSLIGKPVTLAYMYRVRDAITAQYRRNGYTLSQAIITPQRIHDGVIHIRVVEGYIGKVSFEGDLHDARGLLNATAKKIQASKPLRQQDLERYTLLLGDLPGVEVSTVLKPSPDTPAAADLVIILKRRAFQGALSLDNRGSQAIGPVEGSLSVDFNNLFGLSEQTSILAAAAVPTHELRYIAAHHTEILNAEGLRLTLSASNSLSKPGGAISVLEPRGTGTIASLFLSAPIIRTRAKSLKLEAGFTYQNTRNDLFSFLYSQDSVRYATVRATCDFSDNIIGTSASTLLQVEASHGLSLLGASKNESIFLSRANGRSDFKLVAGELIRVQHVATRLTLALSFTGQYALTPLLSSEQFGLGGRQFGRGFEPSELTGDHGVAFSIEPRFDVPTKIPNTRVQAYAFYDIGKVWRKTPLFGSPAHESLSSAGIGIRTRIGIHISLDFELAKPLTRDIASRGERRLRPLFSVSTSF